MADYSKIRTFKVLTKDQHSNARLVFRDEIHQAQITIFSPLVKNVIGICQSMTQLLRTLSTRMLVFPYFFAGYTIFRKGIFFLSPRACTHCNPSGKPSGMQACTHTEGKNLCKCNNFLTEREGGGGGCIKECQGSVKKQENPELPPKSSSSGVTYHFLSNTRGGKRGKDGEQDGTHIFLRCLPAFWCCSLMLVDIFYFFLYPPPFEIAPCVGTT